MIGCFRLIVLSAQIPDPIRTWRRAGGPERAMRLMGFVVDGLGGLLVFRPLLPLTGRRGRQRSPEAGCGGEVPPGIMTPVIMCRKADAA
ncbi:hypothetical protein GCM10010519_80890 [Streptomyces lactacystinicus]